jgi:hypothetical protein
MPKRVLLFFLLCICTDSIFAQDLAGIEIHGFVTQGFLFSSHNNLLTMQTSSGSLGWTDGAINFSDSLTDKLRVGIQLRMYQLGQLGGPNAEVDWASGDYRLNDYFGIRAGKVKTVIGLFNDSQDIDALFLWTLLPQGVYPVDNEGYFLSHVGGEVYGYLPLGDRGGKLRYDGFAGESYLPLHGGYIKQIADAGLAFTTAPAGKTYGGDLRWVTRLTGLTFGASADIQAMDGTAPQGSVHLVPFLSAFYYAQFTKGKFYFAGEYNPAPARAFLTIGQAVIPIPVGARTWYAMGSYRVSKTFQFGSYYSYLADTGLDPNLAANYSKDWVISGRYDFNSYFYAKIEGHFLHGTAHSYYASTNPNGLKDNSNLLAAKIGFSF